MPHCQLVPRKDRVSGWLVDVGKSLSPDGRRKRYFFKSQGKAEQFAKTVKKQTRDFGTSAQFLDPKDSVDSAEALEILRDHARKHQVAPPKLREIALEWVLRFEQSHQSVTLAQLFEEFMATQAGSSKKHRQSLRYTYERMEQFHGTKVCDLGKSSIDDCFRDLSDSSFNAHLRRTRSFLEFAVKHRYASQNPAVLIGYRKRPRQSVQILPVSTVELMLRTAESEAPSLLPFLYVSLFTGARPEEISRLLWSDFNLDDQVLVIRAEVSKTGRRRIINLSENMIQWLLVIDRQPGDRVLSRFTRATLATARGELWTAMRGQDPNLPRLAPHNCLRHCYVSNYLAAGHSIDSLLLQAGHTSRMMFEHYLASVTRNDAIKYWAIVPSIPSSLA